MTHPPPGKYVSIAANQRVKREDEKAASPDPLPSACSCLLSEHCDSRPGCRLRAGATINQGGGICGPYAQSRAGPLPSDKAVEAAIRHRLTSDGCCPYCLPHGTIEEGPPGATWTVECEHGGIKQTARRYLTAAYAVDMPRLVAERDDLWHKLGETMARANTLEIERDQLRGREAEVRAATLREVAMRECTGARDCPATEHLPGCFLAPFNPEAEPKRPRNHAPWCCVEHAALAAKDREAMIETVARTLAEAFDYSDVFEPDYPGTAMHGPAYWRWLAGQAFTALGLLASPDEKGR